MMFFVSWEFSTCKQPEAELDNDVKALDGLLHFSMVLIINFITSIHREVMFLSAPYLFVSRIMQKLY